MTAPYKTILCIDFETRWSSKPCAWSPDEAYTLSKLTTEEYIRDPRFKAFGACIHELGSSAKTQWYGHDELPKIFGMYDWTKTAVLAHNAMFDVGIMSFIYGVNPCFIFDSLSMARALRGVSVGNSLMRLADTFGLPPKGNAVHSTDGLEEIPAHIEKELAAYCAHDVALCEGIFSRLLINVNPATGEIGREFPKSELRLIDMTLRMFTQPGLVLDVPMLEAAVQEDAEKLANVLERTGVTAAELGSPLIFSALLEKMGVIPPTKKSPANPTKLIPAFAKSDAQFQAMLNGDNEELALLCEARLKVKSTLERTRAVRFIDIARRGMLPVPLQYYGAGTGRWTATGKINLQNLKRGSFLRKAIMAPPEHSLVVADLSQIEPRVLAWLADYTEMLDIFRAGGDPYATFGAQMFGIPGLSKESHVLLRQSAKSAMLGCFGATTLVLTQRGWVPIVDVRLTDTTWDGTEWTTHQGVLVQGEKEVLTAKGVSATSDHAILTGHGWQEWSGVLQNSSLFQSALSLVSLPASAGGANTVPVKTGVRQACLTPLCAVVAGGRGSYTGPTLSTDAVRAAGSAPNERLSRPDGKTKVITQYAETVRTVIGSSIASAQSLFGALTRRVRHTRTTGVAAFMCTLRGSQTGQSSWHTLSPSMAGTTPSCSSIAKTTSGGTYPETYALSHAASTWPTSERSQPEKSSSCAGVSQPSKQRMQTYDIAMAGPRNRYTILTDDGPIIVHNCGYQLGWSSFAGQLLVGFLGAPPVLYTKADAKQLGVTQRDVLAFANDARAIKRMNEIPHVCTEQELLVHCLASKAIIDKYRAAAAPVVNFWSLLGEMIEHCLVGGQEHTYKCLTFKKEEIILANGMSLLYPDLKMSRIENPDGSTGSGYTYADGAKRVKLYPGKVCNNVTQGTARIVMTDGMLRTSRRFPVKGTVHDEEIVLVRDEELPEAKDWIHAQMVKEPKWMPGIPLAADVSVAKRYGDAK